MAAGYNEEILLSVFGYDEEIAFHSIQLVIFFSYYIFIVKSMLYLTYNI